MGFDPTDTGQDTVFVVRHKGQLYGWWNACPHISGAPMAWRKDAYLNGKRTHISCHAHGALFEIETGICIQGPCLGKTLEAVKLIENDNGSLFMQPSIEMKERDQWQQ